MMTKSTAHSFSVFVKKLGESMKHVMKRRQCAVHVVAIRTTIVVYFSAFTFSIALKSKLMQFTI